MPASAAVPTRNQEAKIFVVRPRGQFRPESGNGDAALSPLSAVAHGSALVVAPAVMNAPAKAPVELDEAQREKLLIDHLPQVQYIARRIHDRLPRQVLFEDLVHAGILGLMDAVRKYDPNKNVQLKNYAEFRIRGAILDSLRAVDWSPRALRREARRMEQAVLNCKARMGRDPGEPEIAAELGIDIEALQRLLRDLRGLDVGSLHSDSGDASGDESIQIPTATELGPYHLALRSEMAALLDKGIGELPERERQVLVLYHYQELTMKEIGAMLGIGESRVSQIHTAVLVRLRARLRDLLDQKPPAANGAAIVAGAAAAAARTNPPKRRCGESRAARP